MVAQVRYMVARRSRGQVAPCAVCSWHVETRSTCFLVEPQNQGCRFVSGLALKALGWFLAVWPQNLLQRFSLVWPQNKWRRFSPVWPQNWWRRFLMIWPQNRWWVSWLRLKTKVVEHSWFGTQNQQLWFGDLDLKITATVFWFVTQNQADFGLSVVPQNRWREVSMGYASRSSGLLGMEASLARVFQSGLKTGEGTTTGGACGTIAEVASEAS
jgi:hypothetical protein